MKMYKDGTVCLNTGEHGALVEALRRRSRFLVDPSGGEGITQQWTGLGSETEYKSAANSGLMEIATARNKRYMTRWKLTEKGARIVVYWMGKGYDHNQIETSGYPSPIVPKAIL